MRTSYKNKRKTKIIFLILVILSTFICFIYYLDRIIAPTAIVIADAEMRAICLEEINRNILEVYSSKFNYDDIIRIDKDKDGNITFLKADTVKMNAIASEVALKTQENLKNIGEIGIKFPLGYITKNNLLSYFGPKVTIRMEPIGRIETAYSSVFESAGINQTRHKIYIEVTTKVRVIIPTKNNEVEIKSQIPIAETIIVGKIPSTSINFGK